MVPSLEKTKFEMKSTKDMESMSSVDEVMDSEALMIGEIPISLNCSTVSLTLPTIFKSKKIEEDLVKVEWKHPTLRILPLDITIGRKTKLSAFFVIDSTTYYNILLLRDWIHANWCATSFLHQFLLFWKGNEVEVVRADKKSFMAATGSMEAKYYDQEFGPIKFTSIRKDGILRKAYMDSKDSVEIWKEAVKLLKVTTIMPYRPMSGPII